MKWHELSSDDAIYRAVQGGERVMLTHDGKPIAEVTPIRRPRRFVPTEEILQAKRSLPGSDSYAQLRADIDAVIDPYDDLDRRNDRGPADDTQS